METTPIPPYLLFASKTRKIHRLRRRLIASKWRQMHSVRRRLGYCGVVLGWPLIAGAFTWKEYRHYGQAVRRLTGKLAIRQFVEQWWLATWYGLSPHAYYKFGLFDPQRRASAAAYLHNQELAAIVFELNPKVDRAVLNDKATFEERCEESGLPGIRTLAVFSGGKVTGGTVRSADELPRGNLFAKPVHGGVGVGTRAWRWVGDHYVRHDGTRCTANDVFDYLVESSRSRDYLLQPAIVNHSDLTDLTPGGLCTMRVLTGCHVSGEVEILAAIFKMPTKNGIADNFAAGGIACPIDLATGRLGRAAGKAPIAARLVAHPDTGARIEDRTVPDWQATVELAKRAHCELSELAFVGWDIAVTPDGPLLVEGNCEPCLELLQKGGDCPVGESRFVDFCLERFDALDGGLRPHIQSRMAGANA